VLLSESDEVLARDNFQRTAVTGVQALEQRKVVRLIVHGSGVLAPRAGTSHPQR
jgi:hypothetical protein